MSTGLRTRRKVVVLPRNRTRDGLGSLSENREERQRKRGDGEGSTETVPLELRGPSLRLLLRLICSIRVLVGAHLALLVQTRRTAGRRPEVTPRPSRPGPAKSRLDTRTGDVGPGRVEPETRVGDPPLRVFGSGRLTVHRGRRGHWSTGRRREEPVGTGQETLEERHGERSKTVGLLSLSTQTFRPYRESSMRTKNLYSFCLVLYLIRPV